MRFVTRAIFELVHEAESDIDAAESMNIMLGRLSESVEDHVVVDDSSVSASLARIDLGGPRITLADLPENKFPNN